VAKFVNNSALLCHHQHEQSTQGFEEPIHSTRTRPECQTICRMCPSRAITSLNRLSSQTYCLKKSVDLMATFTRMVTACIGDSSQNHVGRIAARKQIIRLLRPTEHVHIPPLFLTKRLRADSSSIDYLIIL
jgi:hypothetical protein